MIDTRTLKVVKSVPVGKRPRDIAFTPDSGFAYVTGEFDASLYRIGLQGDEPARRVLQLRKEARPMAVVLDAQRKRLYMSTGRGGTVAIIDIASLGAAAAGRSAGRNTALGNRPLRGWQQALYRERPLQRCEHRRYRRAAHDQENPGRPLTLGRGARPRLRSREPSRPQRR